MFKIFTENLSENGSEMKEIKYLCSLICSISFKIDFSALGRRCALLILSDMSVAYTHLCLNHNLCLSAAHCPPETFRQGQHVVNARPAPDNISVTSAMGKDPNLPVCNATLSNGCIFPMVRVQHWKSAQDVLLLLSLLS